MADVWGNYTPTNGNGIGKGYDEKGYGGKGYGEKGYGEKGYGQKGYGKDKGKEKGWKGQVKLPDISYAGKQLTGRVKVDYKPHPTVDQWDERQIELQRYNHRIEVQVSEGELYNVPAPATDLTFMNGMADNVAYDMHIRRPTPIQMQVWPAAMSGRDIIGVAPTGSGKTLAYMLPMFEHCQAQPKMTASGPVALILVPNGDLAKQIWSTFEKCRNARRELKMALAVPGENLPRNDERYHILVASPGKLHELIRNLNQETTQFFEYTTYMVVDEADHLLKDGEKDGADLTIQIMRQLRPDIQMLYFTATWDESLPSQIGRVFKSNSSSREPLLEVIVNGKTLSACRNVQQCFLRRTDGEPDRDAVGEEREESRALNQYWMEEDTKEDALYSLLYWTVKNAHEGSDPGNSKILVFTNSKKSVDDLYDIISQNDIPVQKLTGETYTRERNNIVASFADPKKTDYLILITTDMLGRGIDFTTCRYVILYDFPHHRNSVREYVHRIGRTGRAGRQGFAITLLDEKEGDFRHCAEIVKVLEASGQKPRQWMVHESSGRRQKYHRDIYFNLRNQRPEEPLTPRAEAPPTTPTAPAPTAPDPLEPAAPMENLPDVGDHVPQRVQREYKYGSVLAHVNIPCSPMYDLDGFGKDHRVPMTGKVDTERRFPIIF